MTITATISKFLKWLVTGAPPAANNNSPRQNQVAGEPLISPGTVLRPPSNGQHPIRCPAVDPIQLTAYWRGALDYVDFKTLNPAYAKCDPVLLAIPWDEVAALATELDDGSGQQPGTIKEVNVVFCLSTKGRKADKPKHCHPLIAVPAILADAQFLAPRLDAAPVFNPNYLAPQQGKECFAYAERDAANTALYDALKDMASTPNLDIGWPIWWETCIGAIRNLVGADTNDKMLELFAGMSGVDKQWELSAFVFEAKGSGARGIKSVYTTLLTMDKNTFPALYQRFCGSEQAQKTEHMPVDYSESVVGHIDECDGPDRQRPMFPLDDTQRTAVCAIANLQDGEVQAVNGPPGSGKTSMLRAVVASRWVNAAIKKEPCPIIIACGATNQSVTNVIEAFGKAPHTDASLPYAQRWIADVPSYGGYLPSATVLADEKKKAELTRFICLKKSTTTGFHYQFVDRTNALDPARALDYEDHYVACARRVLKKPNLIWLEDAVDAVHQMLCEIEKERQQFRIMLKTSDHAIWLGLLKTAMSRSEHVWHQDRRDAVSGLEKKLATNSTNINAAEGIMDLVWRADAFHWAARYWEGQFLLAQRTRLLTRHSQNVEDGLRRLCMLLPCLVSTLHSVPNFCEIDPDPNEQAAQSHLFGVIDLLVIDEAGQATPELAGAAIALARRAAVIGDLNQLPPIWNNTDLTELALAASVGAGSNLEGIRTSKRSVANGSTLGIARLLSNWREDDLGVSLRYHYRCKPSIIGYCNTLSYDGTLITRTKEAVSFPEPSMAWVAVDKLPTRAGGSYRNDAEAQEMVDWVVERWPVWQQHDDTQGKMLSEIVALITAYRPQANQLRERLDQAFNHLRITTPSDWPTAEDVTKVTIGTVHQLQGAERPIVCFSLVEGPEQSSNSFIDRDASLMNVGISRAKRSFIIFANPERLFPLAVQRYAYQASEALENLSQFTPTHQLGAYLLKCQQAEALYPKKLVIIEAPGKRVTLEDMLGKQSAVRATKGALFKLPLGSGVDIYAGFVPRPVPEKDSDGFVREVDKVLAIVDQVFITTDDDRMGEYIAWQFQQLLGKKLEGKTIGRVRLGAVTRQAVLSSMATPGRLDERKVLAEVVREVVDCLSSERLSNAVRRHQQHVDRNELKAFVQSQTCEPGSIGSIGSNVSLGRVQAAILRMMLDEARVVIAAQDRKRIWAIFNVGEKRFFARLINHSDGRDTTESGNVENVLNRVRARSASVIGVPRKLSEKVNIPGADTLSVMIEAWQRFKLTPWVTMEGLQALYDGTWSTHRNLDSCAQPRLDPTDPILPPDTASGHPPITPLDRVASPEVIGDAIANQDWAKVYEVIWDRHISGQGEPRGVLYLDMDMKLASTDDQQVRLRFEASSCENANTVEKTLLLQIPDRTRHNDAQTLLSCWPQLNQISPEYEVEAAAQWTLSFDSLLQMMDRGNIGRPSSFAKTMEKMIDSRLIVQPVDSAVIRFTAKGLAAALSLEKHEPELSAPTFSGALSHALALIESGEKGPREVLGSLIPHLAPDCQDPSHLQARIWNTLPELESRIADSHTAAFGGGLIGPDKGAIDS